MNREWGKIVIEGFTNFHCSSLSKQDILEMTPPPSESTSLERIITFDTAPPNAVAFSSVRKDLTFLTSHLKFEYLKKNQIRAFTLKQLKSLLLWIVQHRLVCFVVNKPACVAQQPR
jgi:hypothetical protein